MVSLRFAVPFAKMAKAAPALSSARLHVPHARRILEELEAALGDRRADREPYHRQDRGLLRALDAVSPAGRDAEGVSGGLSDVDLQLHSSGPSSLRSGAGARRAGRWSVPRS